MHVGVCTLTLALEIFPAHKAAVDIECGHRNGALLMKVEVEHMSSNLPQIWALDHVSGSFQIWGLVLWPLRGQLIVNLSYVKEFVVYSAFSLLANGISH